MVDHVMDALVNVVEGMRIVVDAMTSVVQAMTVDAETVDVMMLLPSNSLYFG